MPTQLEIETLIRHALDRLAEKNGHHDFELLCFELARLRICSNVRRPTGPVGNRGDAGRDFSGFRTYIKAELGPTASTFKRLISDRNIVFACSLQKDIEAKIKEDLNKLLANPSGDCESIDEIYYFHHRGIADGDQRKLAAWAREKYAVTLVICDACFLGSHLAAEDTRWIAACYLDVPVEVAGGAKTPEELEVEEMRRFREHFGFRSDRALRHDVWKLYLAIADERRLGVGILKSAKDYLWHSSQGLAVKIPRRAWFVFYWELGGACLLFSLVIVGLYVVSTGSLGATKLTPQGVAFSAAAVAVFGVTGAFLLIFCDPVFCAIRINNELNRLYKLPSDDPDAIRAVDTSDDKSPETASRLPEVK